MFRWYGNAKICYAYLSDVTDREEFSVSRWFTRGWTLQELIAPKDMRFYSQDWAILGSKADLQDELHKITGIDIFVLSTGIVSKVSVAKKMCWAASRETSRIEDQAYSLMGIFDVNMPLIYGEGKKAFLRLQQEILRVSDDMTLFAWGAPNVFLDMHGFLASPARQLHGLFAGAPDDFDSRHEILNIPEDRVPPVIHGNGVRLEYPVCMREEREFVILACTVRHIATAYIGIPVKRWSSVFYARCGQLILIFPDDWTKAQTRVVVVKEPPFRHHVSKCPARFQIVRVPDKTRLRKDDAFVLDEVFCLPQAKYNPSEHSISIPPETLGPMAVLFFQSSSVLDEKRRSSEGLYPIHCFAIALGISRSHKYPWAMFVPIIQSDDQFHEVLRASHEMARLCMTRSQLKDRLPHRFAIDIGMFPHKRNAFNEPLAVWAQTSRGTDLANYRKLEISVSLVIDRINLVDDAVFVSIDIYEIDMGWSISRPAFIHSKDDVGQVVATEERREVYRPNWWTMSDLEWFKDHSANGSSAANLIIKQGSATW